MEALKHTKSRRTLYIYLLLFAIAFCYYVFFKITTPSDLNLSYNESIPIPEFSKDAGIFDKPFYLELKAPEGFDIYYTLDGSIPTINSKRYKKKILLNPQKNYNEDILYIPTSRTWTSPVETQNHAIIVRALCCNKAYERGDVKSVIYSNSTIKEHKGFQVIHILTDNDNFFSQEKGIYVLGEEYYSKNSLVRDNIQSANYLKRGEKWERAANMVLLDSLGKAQFEQRVGVRINGQGTRVYNQKSLRVIVDEKQKPDFTGSIFKNAHYPIKKIVLRSSTLAFLKSQFKDPMIEELSNGCNVEISKFVPGVVYINGNYWGIHNIKEKFDESELALKHNTDTTLVSFYKVTEVVATITNQELDEIKKYVDRNILTEQIPYNYVKERIDLDSFVDFIIIETFFANIDCFSNNVLMYKISDGKWRHIIHDMDFCFGYFSDYQHTNMFHLMKQKETSGPNRLTAPLFYKLMENETFRHEFSKRYRFLVETKFNSKTVLDAIDKYEKIYSSEMIRQDKRWRMPSDIRREQIVLRNSEIDLMRTFAKERPEIALSHLEDLLEEYKK